MRKLTYTTLALVALAAGYVAYPFFTAWSIREAVRSGNSSYLEQKIEWDGVRETLRQSLAAAALDRPDANAGDLSGAGEKPGLWQRIKARVGQRAVDKLVASYVTPEGLPRLFTYRKIYRERISGEEPALPWHRRLAGFWSRVKRAEFLSLTAFRIEMADRYDASRHYIGLLRLRGVEWKLTGLSVRMVGHSAPLAQSSAS